MYLSKKIVLTMSSTTNIEVALPHRDRWGRPDHLVSIQGLLDEKLAKQHLLRAEHRWKGVQLNKMLVLLSEIQDGQQQQQLEKMEHFMSSLKQWSASCPVSSSTMKKWSTSCPSSFSTFPSSPFLSSLCDHFYLSVGCWMLYWHICCLNMLFGSILSYTAAIFWFLNYSWLVGSVPVVYIA